VCSLTHPEVVHHLANPLIFHGNFFTKILIKARFYGERVRKTKRFYAIMCKNEKLQGLVGRRKKINKKKNINTLCL